MVIVERTLRILPPSWPLLLTILLIKGTIAPDPAPDDPYILCSGDVPQNNGYFGGWPTGFSPNQYVSTLQLCSASLGLADRNVGCLCNGQDQAPTCYRNYANTALFDYQLAHYTSFPWLCENYWCYCASPDIVNGYEAIGDRSAAVFIAEGRNSDFPLRPNGVEPAPDYADADIHDSASSLYQYGSDSEYDELLCGLKCEKGSDCKPQEGNSCGCKITSSQIVPGASFVLYQSTCGVISLGGKREEQVPCVCNATYVSHSCCGADDGLVWEAPEMKLGELDTAQDL